MDHIARKVMGSNAQNLMELTLQIYLTAFHLIIRIASLIKEIYACHKIF